MIVRVQGRSMLPALRPGDFLWVKKAPLSRRGQIALVAMKNGDRFLKRVIGLPGEKVEIRSGRLYINERLVSEPYVPESAYLQPQPDREWSLELETYVVLGDTRDDSLDSRRFGPIFAKDILGIAVRKLWPPKTL